MITPNILPVVVIGAGPVGLAAAAHLLARGETPLVLERGAEVGANIRQWAHVQMFSTWEMNIDKAAAALLESCGWQSPNLQAIPTGGQLLDDYLVPLSNLPQILTNLRLNTTVTAISRYRTDKMKDARRDDTPFVVRYQTGDGEETQVLARAVIDASGTWHKPNPLGSDGLPAIGEQANSAHIAYGIPDIVGGDFERYANKRVMVVGGGHSAINALLELGDILNHAPETRVLWVMRKPGVEAAYGGLGDDMLPARGRLGLRIKAMVDAGQLEVHTPVYIQSIRRGDHGLIVSGETADGTIELNADEIITATGFRPDLSFASELRLGLDPSVESTPVLAPMIDPNLHSCGTVRPHGEAELRHPEKNFYIVGMKSYGRAPTFLLATGYEQVRSVVAALVGDHEAARKVELALPETGVCSGVDGGCEAPAPVNANVSFAPGLITLTSLDTLKVQLATGTSCSGPNCCS